MRRFLPVLLFLTLLLAAAPGSVLVAVAASSTVSGIVLLRSAKTISTQGGKAVPFTLGIKNTGTASWNLREIREPNLSAAAASSSVAEVRDPSWLSMDVATAKAGAPVPPGGLDLFSFTFDAPAKQGSYVARFTPAVDGAVVPGLSVDIPVDVTANAPQVLHAPLAQPNGADQQMIQAEPTIRVGVLIVDSETNNEVRVSCQNAWDLYDVNGALMAELPAGKSVEAFYKNGRYWFDRGMGLETTSFPIRFVPNVPNDLCKVENFDRRVTRHDAYAFNTFRNVLELRYNAANHRTWLINELPMETYLKGIGETSNGSPPEYQKALITAARTYAFYLWQRNTKHAAEGFQISAYADDQVYWGAGQEAISPNISAAVNATRGDVVWYGGDLALTPYFSSSDGRTRAWSEVWAGSVPWLISVPAPCDAANGMPLRGHGVGMSASEAVCQAQQGKPWQAILQYFYPGTSIMQRWL